MAILKHFNVLNENIDHDNNFTKFTMLRKNLELNFIPYVCKNYQQCSITSNNKPFLIAIYKLVVERDARKD